MSLTDAPKDPIEHKHGLVAEKNLAKNHEHTGQRDLAGRSNKYKAIQLFIILLTHVTLLDLFFVGRGGLVFLWQENLNLETLVVHLLLVSASVGFYQLIILFNHYRNSNRQKGLKKTSEKFWLLCSVVLLLAIIFLLM